MNQELDQNDTMPAEDGIQIQPLNQVDPASDGGGDDVGFTLTIVLTVCA